MSVKPEHGPTTSTLKACLSFTFGLAFFILFHLSLGGAWLLIYIIRWVAIAISKRFVPGVGRVLSWKDMVVFENYNERHRMSIVTMLTFRGDISLSTIQPLVTDNILVDRIKSSGRLRFPEGQQYQTNFLGFRFWKDDPTFHLDNHCSEVFADDPDTPSYLRRSYEEMVAELSGKPYPPRRSPWQIILVRRFREANGELNTVFIFRVHHSFMDGSAKVALLNKLVRGGGSPVVHIPEAKTLQIPDKFKILDFVSPSVLVGFFSAFSSLTYQVTQNLKSRRVIASAREKQGVVNKDMLHFKLTSKLPLSDVKELAAHLGVRVPSLLTTLIAKNLAKVLPSSVSSINVLYAIALAKHPGRIANHASLGQVMLPLCREEEEVQLNCISVNDTFIRWRFDPSILAIGYLSYFVGHCPAGLVAFVTPFLGYYPVTITNFAIGSKGFNIGGVECVDIKGGVGAPRKVTDCMITSLGFKSNIQMLLAGTDDFLSEGDMDRVATGIGKDFAALLDKVIPIDRGEMGDERRGLRAG